MNNDIFCTHAGGIVFRRKDEKIEYLLIGPSKERPGEWLFPKGHIEQMEDCQDAARREVEEETGAIARFLGPLEVSVVQLTKKRITVQYFLMEMISQGPAREKRRMGWFPFDEAVELLSHESNRTLLKEAEKMRVLTDKTHFPA